MTIKFLSKNFKNNIPSSWEQKPFWNIAKQKSIIGQDNLELLSVYLNKGVIRFADVKTKRTNVTSDDKSKYQRVDPGDFVMNNQQSWRGSVGISQYKGIVSPAYLIFEISKELNSIYANYLFRDKFMVEKYLISSRGVGSIQRNLHYPSLRNIKVLIPPINEQKIIAEYLNKKTKQIDLIIEKIEKKIQLIYEEREILINQYVTKGLNKNVEMRDSGNSFIGEIPKDWKIQKLKYISNFEFSTVNRHVYADENKVLICHYPDAYKNEYIQKTLNLSYGTCTDSELEKFTLLEGDILLTKDSESPDDIGIPTIISEELINTVCGYHLALIRLKNDFFIPEYIYRFLESKSSKDYFYISANGITRYGLGKSSIGNIEIPYPNKDVQVKIVAKIKKISKFAKDSEFFLNEKINLLREFRKSLISSAVTGNIRITEDMI